MGIKDVINIEDYKDYMLVALDNEGNVSNEINFNEKLGIYFYAGNILIDLLKDEINERVKNISNEELLVIDYNINPTKYNESEGGGSLELLGVSLNNIKVEQTTKISTFQDFIKSQISKGKITEEYATVHDYYIGIGKTEEEVQAEITELRDKSKIYCTNETIEEQSSIIYPDGTKAKGTGRIFFSIPYEKGEYNFAVETSKKTSNIKIKIGDYVGVGVAIRKATSLLGKENKYVITRCAKFQYNVPAMFSLNVSTVYMIDITNKKLLKIDGAKVNINYYTANETSKNEVLDVPADLILDKGEFSVIDYVALTKQIQELLTNKGATNYEELIDIELVSDQIKEKSKFQILSELGQENQTPSKGLEEIIN